MIKTGKIDNWLKNSIFHPFLSALTSFSGETNFRWARRAYLIGALLVLIGAFFADSGWFFIIIMTFTVAVHFSSSWSTLNKLEFSVKGPTDAISPIAIRCIALISRQRQWDIFFSILWFYVAIIGFSLFLCILALGMCFFTAAGFWSVDFKPPGKSLRQRIVDGVKALFRSQIPVPVAS